MNMGWALASEGRSDNWTKALQLYASKQGELHDASSI